jgi:aldehyde dehydrogenase (NAD+)
VVAAPTRAETGGGVQTFGNYIAGEWRPAATGETLENRSPSNRDDLVGLFAASGPDDVRAAVDAAAEAFETWGKGSPIARANILHKAANILEGRIEQIGRELAREEGKTLKEGMGRPPVPSRSCGTTPARRSNPPASTTRRSIR